MNKILPFFALLAFGLSGCITPPVGVSQPSHFYRLDLPQPVPSITNEVCEIKPEQVE